MRPTRPIHLRLTLAVLIVLLAVPAPAKVHHFLMPREQMARFRNIPNPANGEGSCVFASSACAGAHAGIASAEYFLEDHPRFGPAVLGGAWPERVEREFAKRKIPIYNIEGSQTIEWIQWALKRGHYVPITYGVAHMIAAVGVSEDAQTWWIWDNNYPTEVRKVSRSVFIKEHRRFGGGWCVIFKRGGPPPWVWPKQIHVDHLLARKP
jgi:hypothetical protein